MEGKILIPLDGHEYAEQAVPVAAEIAAKSQLGLRLVTVANPRNFTRTETAGMGRRDRPQPTNRGMDMDIYASMRQAPVWSMTMYTTKMPEPGQTSATDALTARIRSYLSGVAEKLEDRGVEVETAVGFGRPSQQIVIEAERSGAVMIVMTASSRYQWGRGAIGNTADQVIRSSSMPVLLVKPVAEAGGAAAPDTVIVGLDGSPGAEAMLPMAAEFARATGARLALVSASKRDSGPQRDEAEQYLDRVAEPYRPGVMTRVVRGRADTAVREFADGFDRPVIAATPDYRSGLNRWLRSGSASERIIRNSHYPVLVLPTGY